MEVRPLDPVKALFPMYSRELENSTDVKPVKPNAELSIRLTELGNVIDFNVQQPLNVPAPIVWTVFGITVFWHPAIKVLVLISMMQLQLSPEV